jgi:hypothetical protein
MGPEKMTYALHGVKRKGAALAVAALLLSASATVMAAPPFEVCRSTDPSQVGLVAPLAVVPTGPYDDNLDLLDDGATYFYMVRDDQGRVLDISINKNGTLNTVRIGFDDTNDLSASVDPSSSPVVASPETVPADGITAATVIVTPRDANGDPLGAGLDVTVDGIALFPGTVKGTVIDRGDGSYEIQVVSSTKGSGEVWVSVEGIALDATPTITFEEPADPDGLREQGRQLLDDMTEDDGLFEQVLEGLDPSTDPGADKVSQAWDDALVALANLPAGALGGDVNAIDNDLKAAVGNLVAALGDPGGVDPAAIMSLIEFLVDAARMVALEHLEWAEDSCGPCVNPSQDLCKAWSAFDNAEEERAEENPDYEEVVNKYGKAIAKAMNAVDSCS